jgi:hypothetical protein
MKNPRSDWSERPDAGSSLMLALPATAKRFSPSVVIARQLQRFELGHHIASGVDVGSPHVGRRAGCWRTRISCRCGMSWRSRVAGW